VIASALGSSGRKEIPNPYYPEENFDEYMARIIQEKKKKIERLLDLK